MASDRPPTACAQGAAATREETRMQTRDSAPEQRRALKEGQGIGCACGLGRRAVLGGLAAGAIAAAGAARSAPARPRTRIDVHHHFLSPALEQAARRRNQLNPAFNGLTIDRSLEEMDRNGVSQAILSMASPGVWYGDVQEARLIARDANDFAARAMADHT